MPQTQCEQIDSLCLDSFRQTVLTTVKNNTKRWAQYSQIKKLLIEKGKTPKDFVINKDTSDNSRLFFKTCSYLINSQVDYEGFIKSIEKNNNAESLSQTAAGVISLNPHWLQTLGKTYPQIIEFVHADTFVEVRDLDLIVHMVDRLDKEIVLPTGFNK